MRLEKHPIHHCPVHGVERCFARREQHNRKERHWCSQNRPRVTWFEANPIYLKLIELQALVSNIQKTLRSVAGKPGPLSRGPCIQ